MSTRIKVRIEALIEKIEQARDRAVAEYEKAAARGDLQVTQANDIVDLAIRQSALKDTKYTTEDVWQDYRPKGSGQVWVTQVKLPRNFKKPESPSEPNIASYNKDIALLKMADQDTILVSTEDRYGKYL